MADITVVDMKSLTATETYVDGHINMKDGVLYGKSLRFITTERGQKALQDKGYETITIDLASPEPERIRA